MTRVVVSTTGADDAVGDDARPLRTITRALSRSDAATIVVLPGSYAENLRITREVVLEARERATLDGHLRVVGAGADVRRLDVLRGLSAADAPSVRLSALRVGTSTGSDALLLERSRAVLEEITVGCGTETCIQATGSTISADRLTFAQGPTPSRRGLRAETSSVTIRRFSGGGATNVDLQASARSHLTLADAELRDLTGNAIAALAGCSLVVLRTKVSGAGRVAVLVSGADAQLRGLELGPLDPQATGVGVEGSNVRIEDSRFVRAGGTALVVNDFRGRRADVHLVGAYIEHGRAAGLNLGQGKLTVARARFVGDPTADGADAISASGDTADLVIESATIEGSAGHGVGVYNNASARITARITGPRLGGVLVERSAGGELRIAGTTIHDCRTGSGVAIVDALGVELEDVEAARCPEAGLLAGVGAEVTIRRGRFLDNRQYGVAAFGRSAITLGESLARGSKWAAFASCADGSAITDSGGNTLTGATSLCP